jgi:hypothetical protein
MGENALDGRAKTMLVFAIESIMGPYVLGALK